MERSSKLKGSSAFHLDDGHEFDDPKKFNAVK